jgi:succinyl-CoA synthetase beta subunit
MNVHEYQAKEVLASFGVPVPWAKLARTAAEAEAAARELGASRFVVKAQIHAGGRGKGGGVRLAASPEEVRAVAEKMIGMRLVTHQTGPSGRTVHQVLVGEALTIAQELYLSIVLDRAHACAALIASREGGVEIEAVAAERPEAILREHIDPAVGLRPFQARRLAYGLDLEEPLVRRFTALAASLYRAFVETDASLVEVNPLAVCGEDFVVVDAKMNFDDNALFRRADIAAMRDPEEEDPRERAAHEHNLSYVGLNGNIGCMVNGAGLAMATMDIIQYYGGEPANFLDVGGGADVERVAAAFRLILDDSNVRAVLVNIFGGIVKCDVIAQGILDALTATRLEVPLIVRLEGTNVALGRRVLDESALDILSAGTLDEAAQKAVAAAAATRATEGGGT